jgi:lycopene elongase/hydratase (dihydrobisanhydrobacterioruberin-forming)
MERDMQATEQAPASETIMQQSAAAKKWQAVIRLSRWREHVPFTIALVVIGTMLAVHLNAAVIDWRIVPVVLANILAMSFAFMINDVADAPDDALNPAKRQRNPVSNGTLTQREGYLISWVTYALALALYALSGVWALLVGVATLVLCYLYSAHPFRLKARPITDVVSHVLMLSGLLIMSGFFAYDASPGIAWLVVVAAILFSAYGQFYNQVEDYEVDKAAGLKNTVVLLGKNLTRLLMYGCALGAAVSIGAAIWLGAFPVWLGPVVLIVVFVASLFTWDTDMRGNATEWSGLLQKPALLTANIIALLWLAQTLGWLPMV